jgi:hypothetical protein
MRYRLKFDEAITRTKRLGLSVPSWHYREPLLIQSAKREAAKSAIDKQLSGASVDEISRMCVQVHYKLLQPISEAIGSEAYLTFGGVRYHQNQLYRVDQQYYEQLVHEGMRARLLLHCWITTPGMEIIDATLQTTIGVQLKDKSMLGNITMMDGDDHRVEYLPMMVGQDFMQKARLLGSLI